MHLSPTKLVLFLSFFLSSSLAASIGVTYAPCPIADICDHDTVVSTLLSLGVSHVRIPDPNPAIIRSFSYSGISLLVSIPNAYLLPIARNRSNAIEWLHTHIVPYYPRARITAISVGNDILTSLPHFSAFLLPAVQNVYLALQEVGIRKISVSTAHSFDLIRNPFPPSSARFQESSMESVIKPLLSFISAINSSFLISAHPYELYRSMPEIPIGFALFQEHPFSFRDDRVTGVRYRNLFDVMVDAAINAIAAAGHDGIHVVVAETGWPSDGDVNEPDATQLFAGMYIAGLVNHVNSGRGSPLRREGAAEIYIFELFDEEKKSGRASSRHWGVLNSNMTCKYKVDFSGSDRPSRLWAVELVLRFCLVVSLLWYYL
ncbi:hypothetical protein ACLOJK_030192 [Asimina triloba]